MPEFSARHVWSLISKVVLISLVLENFFCENQLMLVQALNNQIWPHFDPAPPSVSLGLPPTFYPFFSTVGSSVALNCICRLYFSIVFLNWISQLYFSIPFSIAFTNCISQKDVHRLSHLKSHPLFTTFFLDRRILHHCVVLLCFTDEVSATFFVPPYLFYQT